MIRLILMVLLGSIALADRAPAQDRWRLAVAVGPYRVDRLAGTPVIPSVAVSKLAGSRAVFGATVGWIRDAGFYGLDALTFDLDAGVRSAGRVEWSATAGPSFMVGGDGDGTPYVGAALHGSVGAIWWFGRKVGLTAGTTGRVWLTTGNNRFSPSGSIGLVLRL
jgi:hypothetical protein